MTTNNAFLPAESKGNTSTNAPDPGTVRRMAFVIGLVTYAIALPSPLRFGGIPFQKYFKDELHLSASEVSWVFLIWGIPNCFRWLAGLLSDRVPLLGSQRRSYLVIAALAGAALWGLVNFAQQRIFLLIACGFAIHVVLLAAHTFLGGLLVDAGRAFNALARFSNARQMGLNCASITAHILGGLVAGKTLTQASGLGVGVQLVMALVLLAFLRDEALFQRNQPNPTATAASVDVEPSHPRFLGTAVGVTFLYYFCPDPGDVLYRFQSDALGFSSREISWLYTLSATGGLLGLHAYTKIAKRTAFRHLLIAAVPVKIVAILLYFAYRSRTSAVLLDGFIGFFDILSVAAIQELAARAAHPRYAALSFGVILGIANLARGFGKIVASSLHDNLALSFQQLLVVQAIAMLAVLLFIPLVPKDITKQEG